MKLLAYLIITASLIAGALSAATAYLVNISDAASHDRLATANLTFKSPAGEYDPTPPPGDEQAAEVAETIADLHQRLDQERQAEANIPEPYCISTLDLDLQDPPAVNTDTPATARVNAAEASAPIARPGDPVTAETLTLLQRKGVSLIRVKEFSLTRWPHNWVFALAVVGLLGGAFIIKAQRRPSRKVSPSAEATQQSDAHAAIRNIATAIATLDQQLPAESNDNARLQRIIKTLGAVQRNDVPAFAADRPQLVADLGLGGFAELMDRFAALERQINRAWSAAADNEIEESLACIDAARDRLPAVQEKLPATP